MLDRRALLAGTLALGGCAALPVRPRADATWRRADAIASGVQRPRIGPGRASITAHGARSGFQHDARPAIHAAMAALGSGGGRVVLPPGEWRSDGPIRLRSGIDLHLAADATLRFSQEPRHFLPLVRTRWEGTELWNYSPLIHADGASDIALTGTGTIDGQGFDGFFRWRPKQRPAQTRLRTMGATGVPLRDRVFGEGHFLRPAFVEFNGCRRVLIEGLRLIDSPFWMVHPVYCDHVTVRDLRLDSAHLNSDGVDPDSSTNVLIERCRFDVGDDGVAIKAGRDQDGWRVGRPSARIVVRDCVYGGTAGGGFAIGSEMSGGVRDVYVERYRMGTVANAIYLKTNLDRGGFIENVAVRDVMVERADCVIHLTSAYHGHRGGDFPTRIRDILVEDVRCDEALVGIAQLAPLQAPFGPVTLRRVAIGSAPTPLRARHAHGLRLEDVRVGGRLVEAVVDSDAASFATRIRS